MERFSKTKRLYYENSYEKSFTALVTGVGEDEHGEYVLLDQTLFFPEGGGQPSDRGTLGGHDVVDVQLVEGEIRHYIKKELEKGDSVDGMIDWDRRFDLMQQHSGEHMVSGMIHRRFGYDNVGFHMGERFVTIDINGLIDEDQLSEIEQAVNAYIWTNQASRVFFADEEEKTSLPYRSKLELTDEVRLVEFPGADLCACCGLHVGLAGEVGLVKLVSVHRFRQGVRIEMLSGRRAFDYLNSHFRQNSHIATALSVKPGETLEAVGRMQEENYRLRGEIIKRDRERYRQIAGACQDKGNVVLFARDFSPEDIRKILPRYEPEVILAAAQQRLLAHIHILSQHSHRGKILAFLEYYRDRAGENPFRLPMSLTDAADYLAIDRSAMMREIGLMETDSLFSHHGRTFRLP